MFRFFHRYGFGIQSPWAYSLVRNVLFESLCYYAYDDLRKKYPTLSRKERKRNEQLFRIVNHFKPSEIVVAGNCPPATKDYLQAPIGSAIIPAAKVGSAFFYFGEDMRGEVPREMPANAVVIIDDIGHSNKTVWEQFLQQPQVTAIFEMGYRGVLFFDPKRIRQTYRL